jgi:hypothetical protein
LKAIKKVQETALQAARKAQQRQEDQANKKRRPVDFYIHDKVFFKKKGFATQALTTRLDFQWAGPFEIEKQQSYSYVLKLPENYKMRNLFYADRLRKADDKPFP